MATLEKRALEMALNALKGLDARFRIELPSGEVYGELALAPPEPERKRKPASWPLGSMTKHFRPHLESMVPGETKTIPCDHFGFRMQNAVTGWASKYWGAGSYVSKYDKENNTISIMRMI